MQVPFSQTMVGAILVAVVAGLIVLVLQNMFLAPQPTANAPWASVPQSTAAPAGEAPVYEGPDAVHQIACESITTAEVCFANDWCQWNMSNADPGMEMATGWCVARH